MSLLVSEDSKYNEDELIGLYKKDSIYEFLKRMNY